MNFNRARSWPHPVLSPLSDDVMPNHFDFRLDVLPEHKRWILDIEASDEDATLAHSVQTEKARYLAHVECKRTYFRAAHLSHTPRFEMEIDGDALFGAVEVSLLVVAAKDLKEYRHPNQHADYRDGAFNISIGEPLAVAVSKSFDAFLEYDPILKLSSIINIMRDTEDEKRMKVNCRTNRIVIILPSAEYDRYRAASCRPSDSRINRDDSDPAGADGRLLFPANASGGRSQRFQSRSSVEQTCVEPARSDGC